MNTPDAASRLNQFAEVNSAQEKAPLLSLTFQGHEKTYRSWRGSSLKCIEITELEGVDGKIGQNSANSSGSIELPAPMVANLRQFFDEHILHPKANERYNCHYLGYSLAGWPGAQPPRTRMGGLARVMITGHLNMVYDPGQLQAVADPSKLEAGKIYGIGKSGKIFHTLVGLDGPSLSVIGIGTNPGLVVADGGELADFYGGEMYEISSPSIVPTSVYTPPA